jgi:hypothetical protein
MAVVSHNDRSFLIDGRPIWLVSGSIHYFRVPSALWRDRLVKAKRAGLNCIDTYVAWNFHEQAEGRWDFSGDRDVVAFARMAGELGLYVILRPGPYICAEWDFGGLPAYLTTQTGIAYRTANAAYTHYYDRYFRQLLPRLAELQVTRGGSIILIQNENEYFMTTMPDRLSHLEFISQLFRRSGFDIPIITCNGLTDPPVPGTIECVNTYDNAIGLLKRLRLRQGQAPLVVTEFWSGWFDHWGGPHNRRDPRDVARRALEILGCGAQFNYYMFHGGTNFGFWGSRLAGSDCLYQTTSYDYDAPIAEGGALTEKYYYTRLVNMLANHMGPYFAQAGMDRPGLTVQDSTNVLGIHGPRGRWVVVTNNGRNDIGTARVSLPDGMELEVSLAPIGAVAIPFDLKLDPTHALDYCNLMPLGFFGGRVLLLHGPADWNALFSINGKAMQRRVPSGGEPTVLEHQDLIVVLVNSELAMRTWLVDETLVFGPKYVGEDIESALADDSDQCFLLPLGEGGLQARKFKPASPLGAAPKLGSWRRLSVCREPVDAELAWQKIDRPRGVDDLGLHYGYVWYRLELTNQRRGRRHLFLPACEDRATIYLNGALVGTWGRGDGAARQPMSATFRSGRNVLTMLVDNLGRLNLGPHLGEEKGLLRHIYDARELPAPKFKLKTIDSFPRRVVPRHLQHYTPVLEACPAWQAEGTISLAKVAPIHLSFIEVPHHVAILCNERTIGFFPQTGANYGDATLGAELRKGRNVLKIILWGDVSEEALEKFHFHLLAEAISQNASWGFRPWTMPVAGGHVVGKNHPAWYVARFACGRGPHAATDPGGEALSRREHLFLHIVGARKGQLFLNGHNVGRFWTIGPQQYYYLPSCWLADDNELLVFEEHGDIPRRSRLEYRPRGPYND